MQARQVLLNGKYGHLPDNAPVLDQAGNLYGTTVEGGAKNAGTVYELIPGKKGKWTEKVLYSFKGKEDSANPWPPDIYAMYRNNKLVRFQLKTSSMSIMGTITLNPCQCADHYLEKRVRFSAFVKTEGTQDWAGLWMRVDKESIQLAFDNMQDRSIRRTTYWKRFCAN